MLSSVVRIASLTRLPCKPRQRRMFLSSNLSPCREISSAISVTETRPTKIRLKSMSSTIALPLSLSVSVTGFEACRIFTREAWLTCSHVTWSPNDARVIASSAAVFHLMPLLQAIALTCGINPSRIKLLASSTFAKRRRLMC